MSDTVFHLPSYIIKRNGGTVPFDGKQIRSAIERAGKATRTFDAAEARLLSNQALRVITHRFHDCLPHTEQIQDVIEQILVSSNHLDTARACIVYREQRSRLRRDQRTVVDVASSINEYLDRADWRVSANANQGYSLGGLILNVSGKVIANYWLSHVYTPEIGRAHREADIHIHDLDMLAGYCAGWSLRSLLVEGFNGVPGRVEANPPKHLSSAVGQIVNFLGTMQNEWAGAQAFSSFDTYMAPFIRKDNLRYEAVRQAVQELIYNLNVPSRWGTQPPFTNLTFDWICPEDLREQVPVIGGENMSFTYGDLQPEMNLINRAYMEVMTAGDAKGRVFTFPIPTYNITPDFPWESQNTDLLFEMTAKYGLPYFQNFVNSELKPNMVRSMCCRLQLDLTELLKRGNGLFGSAEQTGSVGVVTINCARLGHLHRGDENALFLRLDELLEVARSSLEIKRKTIQRHMDNGLFPYTKRYLGTLRTFWSPLQPVNDLYKHQVLIDEAADFASVQLGCIAALANPRLKSVFACGDFNQRMTSWGIRSLDEVKMVFPDVDVRRITTTYRQSRRLNELARAIVEAFGGSGDVATLPEDMDFEGESPALIEGCPGQASLVAWIAERIREIERSVGKLPSIAIFVRNDQDVQPLAEALNRALEDSNIQAEACLGGKAVGQETDVRVFAVEFIKGLEFESVFFVGVDRLMQSYPDLYDKYLYVGATRAATYLGFTCEGSLPDSLAALRPMFVQAWSQQSSF
jgi:ribonucleoside-triphosphate reductase